MYFAVQTPSSQNSSLYIFISVEHLTTLVLSSPIENKGSLYQSTYLPLKPFVTAPGTFDSVIKPVIRWVSASISSGGGYFDPLL
jgi:hypothetical protein